jgi:hypothetical protein
MYLLFSSVLGWCFIRLFCLNASNLDHHPVAKKGYQHHRVDIGNTHQQSHVHQQQKWNRPIKTSQKNTQFDPTLQNIRKTRRAKKKIGPRLLIPYRNGNQMRLCWVEPLNTKCMGQADCTEAGEAPCLGEVWWYHAV